MKREITLLTLAAAMVFTSCSKEIEPSDSRGDVVATFTTQIQTRVAGNSWSANDQIGIFMIKAGESLASPSIANNADNIAYKTTTAGASGIFSPVDPAQTIYFPQSGNVDFISYYPYKPSLTEYIYPVDVSNQSDQEAIDFLYSNNATLKNTSAPSVAFNFKHKLSKLSIKVSSSGEYTKAELDALVVKVKGLNSTAEFSLAANAISKQSVPADITAKTATAGISYEAIVLPVATLTGASIEFTIAGKTLTWEIKTPAFIEGTRYNYDLVLGSSSVTVGGSTIDDWEDNTEPEEPGEEPIRLIAASPVANMDIMYEYSPETGKIIGIRLKEIVPISGAYVEGGFDETINVTYASSTITMQGTVPNPGTIEIHRKGMFPETINAVYTLNAAGLATSATIESTVENKASTYTLVYQYNADNQLVSVVETNFSGEKTEECTATWINGNLMSCVIGNLGDSDAELPTPLPPPGPSLSSRTTEWMSYNETYTYSSVINMNGALYPLSLPSIYYSHSVVGVFASAMGIMGKGPKNLVSKLTDTDGYEVDFSYTFYPMCFYPESITLRDDPTAPESIETVMIRFK